jgi:Flp pilus assembly protein CpaB
MPRRSPRAVLLWTAAAVVAVATAVFVATDLAALHRRAATLGASRTVAVAAHDLALGTRVSAADLDTRTVHRSQLPAGAVAPDLARDRVIAIPVARGGFVLDRNLAPRRRTGLDGAIPRGMRALRIVVRDSVQPRPGTAVDVLVTDDHTATGEPATAADGTTVAARGVLVLGTDDEPAALDAGSTGTTADGLGVTLLVTVDEAERLAHAAATGIVTLALVPPEEAAPNPGLPPRHP